MSRRSLVAKSTPLGVVQLLTTLGEGPAQGVHIVLVVDVLAAPFHVCMVLRLGISQPASFAFFCIMWFLEVEGGRAHNAPGPTSPGF